MHKKIEKMDKVYFTNEHMFVTIKGEHMFRGDIYE